MIVIGEALIDVTRDASGMPRSHVGGGAFNVARAIARLGRQVTFLSRISTDADGDRLAETLAADGVDLPPGLRDPRPTGQAAAELKALGQATYHFHLTESATGALTLGDVPTHAPARSVDVYAGGLGLVLQPMAAASEALLANLPHGSLVFIDPNIRPAAIPDLAAYRETLSRVLAQADIVKVSDADLAILMPDRDAETAAYSLLEQGPRLVLLTLGERGAVAFGAFGRRAHAAPTISLVDTIGAGDCFSGAWLARWSKTGRDLEDAHHVTDATNFATWAAGLSCERAGAAPMTTEELGSRALAEAKVEPGPTIRNSRTGGSR